MNSNTYGANVKSIVLTALLSLLWIAVTIFLVLVFLRDIDELLELIVFPIFTGILMIIYLRRLICLFMVRFHIDDNEIVIQRMGRKSISYAFHDYRITAEDDVNSYAGAFGLVGLLLAGSKRTITIIESNGRRKSYETHLDKGTFKTLMAQIKENAARAQAVKDQVAEASGQLDQQRIIKYGKGNYFRTMAASIALWLFTAALAGMIYFASRQYDNDMQVFYMILAMFAIPTILVTLINLCFLRRVARSLVLNSSSFTINRREFLLDQVKDLKVTPASQMLIVRKVKFRHNGKKYCYTLGKITSDTFGESTANYYEGLVRYFRVKFRDRPEVLKSGFEN